MMGSEAMNRHAMEGPPGWRCSCGAAFDDYYGLAEHVRLTINCPSCGDPPADLGDGELYRWKCGHWIARDDDSAKLRTTLRLVEEKTQ